MTKNYALFLLNQLCAGASVEAMPIIPQFELSQALSVAIKALEQQPCEDCVSREAVDEYITNLLSGYLYDEERTRLEDLSAFVWELQPVTPQQKIGHWILLDECSNSGYYCSECHKKVIKEGWSKTVKKVKYCPNCGAKMAESEDKE